MNDGQDSTLIEILDDVYGAEDESLTEEEAAILRLLIRAQEGGAD